VRYYYFFGGEW